MELRVAGILVEEGKMLLARHRKRGEDYWVLPGGHVEEGETMGQALVREMKEETDLDVEVVDLLFAHDFVREEPARHVVNLYFGLRRAAPGDLQPERGHKVLKEVRFFTAEEMTGIEIRPAIAEELALCLAGKRPGRLYLGPR